MINPSHNVTAQEGAARYSARLLRRVAEQTGFSYRLSALDLSNDGGALAVELARLARTVTVALDHERDHEATAYTIHRHRARVQLRVSKPTDLVAEGARYWLIAICRPLSSHADPQLLTTLEPLVERGGAVVVLGTRYPRVAENEWRNLSARGLAKPSASSDDADEALLLGSPFDLLERVSVFERGTVSIERAVQQLREVDPDVSVETLRRLGAQATRAGLLPQVVEGHALIAHRSRDRTERWS